ncbi:MAG: hypothetical protein IT497_03700 [Ottowia sp.]|nr:hypothetical protein [Ottowia sp.]
MSPITGLQASALYSLRAEQAQVSPKAGFAAFISKFTGGVNTSIKKISQLEIQRQGILREGQVLAGRLQKINSGGPKETKILQDITKNSQKLDQTQQKIDKLLANPNLAKLKQNNPEIYEEALINRMKHQDARNQLSEDRIMTLGQNGKNTQQLENQFKETQIVKNQSKIDVENALRNLKK